MAGSGDITFTWWSADDGVLPNADGWTSTGTAAVTLQDDGVKVTVTAASFFYAARLNPADRGPREGFELALQAAVQGLSQTPGWPSGAPIVGLVLSDGSRQLGALLGDTVALVDPDTGDVIAETTEPFPWLSREVVRLVKTRTESWSVWSGGRQLLEVPYLMAPELGTRGVAQGRIGFFDPSGTGAAVFDQIELSMGAAPPEPFFVHQLLQSFPVRMLDTWNARHRALLRSIVGLMADVWAVPLGMQRARSAADLPIVTFRADGLRDPATIQPSWTITSPEKLTLVRQRLHVEDVGGGFHLAAELSTDPVPPEDAHFQIRVEGFRVLSAATGIADLLGPVLHIVNGERDLFAALGAVDGGFGWLFPDGVGGFAYTPLGQAGWLVDPAQPHDLELHLFGRAFAMLVVDGRVVDRIPYDLLGGPTPGLLVELYNLADASIDVVWEAERVIAEVSCHDNRARPAFVRRLIEKLLPVGGCERNDEMQVWKNHRPGVLAMRGTRIGILLELRRLCCSEDCYVLEDSAPAAWILGGSWPDITPVILDASGTMLKTFVEFSWGPPGLGLDDTVDFIARHLVPLSTPASTFIIALIAKIAGAPTEPSPGVTRYPVLVSRHFQVGDLVELRDTDDPPYVEAAEVVAVTSTTIDLTTPGVAFGAGDFIRKRLATT